MMDMTFRSVCQVPGYFPTKLLGQLTVYAFKLINKMLMSVLMDLGGSLWWVGCGVYYQTNM